MPLPQRGVIGAAGSGFGKIIGYREAAIISTDLTTYTFSSKNFGAPHPKRCVIVGITCDGSSPAISTVTAGGVSATSVITTISGNNRAAIYIARVPGQITGDIVVTLTQSETNCTVAAFTAILNSTTAAATNSATGTANVTLTIPTYGFAVMAMSEGTAAALTDSGGMTEVFDSPSEGAEAWYGYRTTAGSYTSNIAGDTATNAKVVAAWSLA